MRGAYEGDQVALTLNRGEAGRLAAVLAEATAGSSRAEFFIRVGCSRPNVEALVQALESLAAGRSTNFEIQLATGVEREENPPRPRQ